MGDAMNSEEHRKQEEATLRFRSRWHSDGKTPVHTTDWREVPESPERDPIIDAEPCDRDRTPEETESDNEEEKEFTASAIEYGLEKKEGRAKQPWLKEAWTTPQPEWDASIWMMLFENDAFGDYFLRKDVGENEQFKKARIRLELSEDVQARFTFGTTSIDESIRRDGSIERGQRVGIMDIRFWYEGKSYAAELSNDGSEKAWSALIVKDPLDEIPQAVVDRAAKGVEIDGRDWPVGLYAALPPSKRCQNCGRVLRDPVSKILRYGPTCAKQRGLAHNENVANKVVLARKARLEELAKLAD